MSTTLAMDATKGLVLPPGLLKQAAWSLAGKVSVEIDAQRIIVTPLTEDSQEVQLVNKRGRLVITGLPPASDEQVITSIKAGRAEREDSIAQAQDV